MKQCKIENLTFALSEEGPNIRVISDNSNLLLVNQNIDNVFSLINDNFKIVSSHYQLMTSGATIGFEESDLFVISFEIVMFYLNLYNAWRNYYKKLQNKDLKFNVKDFGHPHTYDIIIDYYKKKYPDDWELRCAILIGKNLVEIKAYYKYRLDYENK